MNIQEIVLDGLNYFRSMPPILKSKSWLERERKKRNYGVNPQRMKNRRMWLIERDGEFCKQCRVVFPLTVDHIIPSSKGGSSDLDNLQLLCKTCNYRKGLTENPNWKG